MWEFLRPFFEWSQATALGTSIRESTWIFAYLEVLHLFGLTALLGGILALSLRLAGWILTTQTVAEVKREVYPYMLGGLVLVTITGVLQFASEAMKCFNSPPFWWKMALYSAAFIFQFTLYRKLTGAGESRFSPASKKLAAAFSIVLWFGVGVMGRAIGFF